MFKKIIIVFLTIILLFMTFYDTYYEPFLTEELNKINAYNQQNAYDTTKPIKKFETETKDSGILFVHTPDPVELLNDIRNAPPAPFMAAMGFTKHEGFSLYREGMTDGGSIMNIKMTNTYGVSDPNPNGIYTLTINGALNNKDLKINEPLDIPYAPGSSLILEIQPKKTSTKQKHYDDVFPVAYRIDITFDSNNVFSLPTNDVDMVVDDSGTLTFTNFGAATNKNRENVGNIKNDIRDKQHFIVGIDKNDNINKIVIPFSVPSS